MQREKKNTQNKKNWRWRRYGQECATVKSWSDVFQNLWLDSYAKTANNKHSSDCIHVYFIMFVCFSSLLVVFHFSPQNYGCSFNEIGFCVCAKDVKLRVLCVYGRWNWNKNKHLCMALHRNVSPVFAFFVWYLFSSELMLFYANMCNNPMSNLCIVWLWLRIVCK